MSCNACVLRLEMPPLAGTVFLWRMHPGAALRGEMLMLYVFGDCHLACFCTYQASFD